MSILQDSSAGPLGRSRDASAKGRNRSKIKEIKEK